MGCRERALENTVVGGRGKKKKGKGKKQEKKRGEGKGVWGDWLLVVGGVVVVGERNEINGKE